MRKYKKKEKFSLDNTIQNTKFDFCKNLKWFLITPAVIILVGVIMLCTLGFNLGIDFTGGTYMTIFVDAEKEYTSSQTVDTNLGAIESKINEVLEEFGLEVATLQETTINATQSATQTELVSEGKAVIAKFQNDNSMSNDEINETNQSIRLKLLVAFGFADKDAVQAQLDEGKKPADILKTLDYAELVQDGGVVYSAASAELMMKSFIALLVAIVLILIYVIFRFEITSGLAAILALFHDVIVTACVVIICRIQVNVAFIAALITILGYSINNTIIIFDRMRESLKVANNSDEKIVNSVIANNAVKDTMMRSILTMVTTFVMIFFITVIGVADIREFAFPIMVGILAGFYSSVFITPGLWAIAYRPRKRKKKAKQKASKPVENVTVEEASENA